VKQRETVYAVTVCVVIIVTNGSTLRADSWTWSCSLTVVIIYCCLQVKSTNFSSTVDLQLLLDSLYRTFTEFKSHEQIENKLIMRKLRSKMRNNEAVCNCHKVSLTAFALILFIPLFICYLAMTIFCELS